MFHMCSLRRYKVSCQMRHETIFVEKEKGFCRNTISAVYMAYTHAPILKGLMQLCHVNRVFLFRLKINHADFFPFAPTFVFLYSLRCCVLIYLWLLMSNLVKLEVYKSRFIIEIDHTKSTVRLITWMHNELFVLRELILCNR